MSDGYVHGSSDAREVARLEKQARWGGPFMLRHFDAPTGARVLDLATGVGAMAGVLLERFPQARVVGIDLSAAQLGWARRNHPSLPVARANGVRLPFATSTFDRVHASWLLEHVPRAVAVAILREVRRVLKPGGRCHFTEVDNSTFEVSPPDPELQAAITALNDAQLRGGGDPFVGKQLERLFAEAGFERTSVQREPIIGSAADPVFFQGFIDEFAEIFEGLDEAMPALAPRLQRAAVRLRALKSAGGTMRYVPVTAQGFR